MINKRTIRDASSFIYRNRKEITQGLEFLIRQLERMPNPNPPKRVKRARTLKLKEASK